MEIKELKIKPSSNRRLLVQQVEQQSEFCDIKVKMGQWERRFHRCVLVASPFFEQAMNSKFKERQTGVVDISVGTPTSTEQSLMFLYGKEPSITFENVGSLLESAEFFMINNLKALCISRLNSLEITDENCIRMLHLSTLYNFNVKYLTKYIEGHLLSLLQKPQAATFTKDSVVHILSDQRLNYVSTDIKLKFVAHWCEENINVGRQTAIDLVKILDFQEVNKLLLRNIMQKSPFSDIEEFKTALESQINVSGGNKVLIMADDKMEGHFLCLDLNRKQWYRINLKAFGETYLNIEKSYPKVAGVRYSSELYFEKYHSPFVGRSIFCLNLSTDECKMYRVVLKNLPASVRIHRLSMYENMCFACTNYRRTALNLNPPRYKYSIIYAGYASRKSVHLSAIFGLKDEHISNICSNKLSVFAIIPVSRNCVYLFDFTNFKLQKVPSFLTTEDKIFPTQNGFVVFNQMRCIFISRLIGPGLLNQYLIQEISLQTEQNLDVRSEYTFCEEYCLRYSEDYRNWEFALHYITHDEMLNADHCLNNWKRLPLPKKEKSTIGGIRIIPRQKDFFKGPVFMMEIPKEKLRCHIDCPHCKSTYRYDTDEDSEDSSEVDSSDSSDYYDGYPYVW